MFVCVCSSLEIERRKSGTNVITRMVNNAARYVQRVCGTLVITTECRADRTNKNQQPILKLFKSNNKNFRCLQQKFQDLVGSTCWISWEKLRQLASTTIQTKNPHSSTMEILFNSILFYSKIIIIFFINIL